MFASCYLGSAEIYPVYRPIYSLASKRIAGYEALIRSRAGIAPEELFKKAENEGKNVEFDIQCISTSILNLPKIGGKLFVNIRPSTLLYIINGHPSHILPFEYSRGKAVQNVKKNFC